jgi:L-ascorbate metabolism protein UlaG (beta-lactamase superfamily)
VREADERRRCTLTWWGHASVELRVDGTRIVTDPLLRARIGPLHSVGHRPEPLSGLDTVDAVLLSHLHRDHTDLPSLRRFGARTRVLVPVGAARVVRASARGPVEELPIGASTMVGTVRVEATAAMHDGRRNRTGAPIPAVGYLVHGSRSVYFAGDTDYFDGMADLARDLPRRLDLALLPVSGWGLTLGSGHMDVEAAVRTVALLRPRVAVPVHWGTLRIPVLWRLRRAHTEQTPPSFAALAARQVPDTAVVVLEPGQSMALPARRDASATRDRQ